MYIKQGSVFKPTDPLIKDGDVWKQVGQGFISVDNSNHQMYQYLIWGEWNLFNYENIVKYTIDNVQPDPMEFQYPADTLSLEYRNPHWQYDRAIDNTIWSDWFEINATAKEKTTESNPPPLSKITVPGDTVDKQYRNPRWLEESFYFSYGPWSDWRVVDGPQVEQTCTPTIPNKVVPFMEPNTNTVEHKDPFWSFIETKKVYGCWSEWEPTPMGEQRETKTANRPSGTLSLPTNKEDVEYRDARWVLVEQKPGFSEWGPWSTVDAGVTISIAEYSTPNASMVPLPGSTDTEEFVNPVWREA